MVTKAYNCLSPVKIPSVPEASGRCGRCFPCMQIKRLEWSNRMSLENYGINYRPLFVTCTYSPQNLPSNNKDCIIYCQKWIKRLRKRLDSQVRYFLVTEQGDKNGRLHQHAVLWIPSIAHLDDLAIWRILYDTWEGGRLTCDPVRSKAGLFYTAKYITKNLSETNDQGYVWSRYENKFVKPGRLYTWSNRPRLGDAGLSRWEHLTSIWVKQFKGLPPNYFNMHLFGKLQKVYIPSSAYKKHLVTNLNFDFKTKCVIEPKLLPPNPNPVIFGAWQDPANLEPDVMSTELLTNSLPFHISHIPQQFQNSPDV